jgi:GNAT superfamily N-acetyltransferase
MIIRPARPDEARALALLAESEFAATLPIEPSLEKGTASLAMLICGDGYVRVAEVDGEIAGFFAATVMEASPWSLEPCAVEVKFVVRPQHRSLRRANAFIDDFEAWAARREVKPIILTAQHDKDGARVGTFYQRKGYQPVETIFIKRLD